MQPPVRVLLIDDHALFRSGLRLVLDASLHDLDVIEAGSIDEGFKVAVSAPALILLDIQLEGLNGLDGLTLIHSRWPGVPVIMLSANHGPETVRQALTRGATAFVSKAESADRIVAAVRDTLRGPQPAEARPSDVAPDEEARLTPRQCEVLDLLCQGLSNKVIARRLDLSEFTVRGHVQSVLRHLKVTSRSEAAFAARQRGLVG